uniref:Uncharacterized protein n=1 Tax=Zea mays TaxID=4577 RepID=C0PN10_MAIZE|nr:unknown [Zea mays]
MTKQPLFTSKTSDPRQKQWTHERNNGPDSGYCLDCQLLWSSYIGAMFRPHLDKPPMLSSYHIAPLLECLRLYSF